MTTPATTPTFPAGLRVLVVDDDPLCLRIVEKMLKRCQYVGEYTRGKKRKTPNQISATDGCIIRYENTFAGFVSFSAKFFSLSPFLGLLPLR